MTLALANGDTNYMPPASARQMVADLALLPVWYAEAESFVLAPSAYNQAFLKEMQAALPLPRYLDDRQRTGYYALSSPDALGVERSLAQTVGAGRYIGQRTACARSNREAPLPITPPTGQSSCCHGCK